MTRFPSAKHLASWAGVCPGNRESAGKRRAANAGGEQLAAYGVGVGRVGGEPRQGERSLPATFRRLAGPAAASVRAWRWAPGVTDGALLASSTGRTRREDRTTTDRRRGPPQGQAGPTPQEAGVRCDRLACRDSRVDPKLAGTRWAISWELFRGSTLSSHKRAGYAVTSPGRRGSRVCSPLRWNGVAASGLGNDLLVFLPELVVCVGIVALLLVRLVPLFDRVHLGGLAVAIARRRACSPPGIRSTRAVGRAVLRRHARLRPVRGSRALPRCSRRRAAHGAADASHRHPRPRRLRRLPHAAARRHARHDADGVGQPPADGVHRGRDGEPAELRPRRLPQGEATGQRGGAEVRRLRGRRQRRHALRHQAAGRHVRHRLPAGRGHGGRGPRARSPGAGRVRAHASSGSGSSWRRCRSTSGARTCSRGRRRRWPGSCRSRRRRRRSRSRPACCSRSTRRAGRNPWAVPGFARAGGRGHRGGHGDVRQPRRVRADEPQAAARVLDHRPRRATC